MYQFVSCVNLSVPGFICLYLLDGITKRDPHLAGVCICMYAYVSVCMLFMSKYLYVSVSIMYVSACIAYNCARRHGNRSNVLKAPRPRVAPGGLH